MSLSWEFPYPSRRSPVFAENVVATSQPLAAQAGLDMLRRGGNAVDAILAAATTLTVVEPTGNGIGGDAFAIVWDAAGLHGLNASGRAPQSWDPARFRGRDAMPETGWDTVTVPGAVSAWSALHDRFGRRPFAESFADAIRYARGGFTVTPVIAGQWSKAQQKLGDMADFGAAFLPGGRAPRAGERFAFPEQADTLERIAESGGESFYRGELAQRIVAHARMQGGALSEVDLGEHRCDWVDCISAPFADVEIHELPPNGQGIATLMGLGILRHLDLPRYPVDSADSIHLQMEAMKIAFAETARHVADPSHMEVQPQALLDEAFLAERAREIDPRRAAYPEARLRPDRGTVFLTAADASGMMVSYIQSNYAGFGSGVVVPRTGISLHNRGSGFVLEPGHPNCVGGGKRPYHTIIPAFVTRAGAPVMGFGVMGGHMQAQGHLQMILRVFTHNQNPQAASDAPRWYVHTDFTVGLEPGFAPGVVAELERRGHRMVADPAFGFGGAQLAYRLENGYCAASDHRKDGQAVGF